MDSKVVDDSLHNYREVLRHVVRPDDGTDRKDSRRMAVRDWQALWLRQGLREYAAYHSPTDEHEQVALAYIEYIDMCVRHERKNVVTLYAHTPLACEVLQYAIEDHPGAAIDVKSEVRSIFLQMVG